MGEFIREGQWMPVGSMTVSEFACHEDNRLMVWNDCQGTMLLRDSDLTDRERVHGVTAVVEDGTWEKFLILPEVW